MIKRALRLADPDFVFFPRDPVRLNDRYELEIAPPGATEFLGRLPHDFVIDGKCIVLPDILPWSEYGMVRK
jgi:hypothetical protein